MPRRKPDSDKPPARSAVLRLLGEALRRLRLERKLSQERLAELAGLNYKYIGRIELGKADAGADVLVRLARALRVPVGELFETITPGTGSGYRLAPSELEVLSTAVNALVSAVDQIQSGQAAALPARAPRKTSR